MSERRTLWALRALAVALAILAWAFISLDRERLGQRPIEATVQYSLPDNLVLLDPVETVSIPSVNVGVCCNVLKLIGLMYGENDRTSGGWMC